MKKFRAPRKFRAQGTGPECPCDSQGLFPWYVKAMLETVLLVHWDFPPVRRSYSSTICKKENIT